MFDDYTFDVRGIQWYDWIVTAVLTLTTGIGGAGWLLHACVFYTGEGDGFLFETYPDHMQDSNSAESSPSAD